MVSLSQAFKCTHLLRLIAEIVTRSLKTWKDDLLNFFATNYSSFVGATCNLQFDAAALIYDKPFSSLSIFRKVMAISILTIGFMINTDITPSAFSSLISEL